MYHCEDYVRLRGSNHDSHVKVTNSYTKEFQRITHQTSVGLGEWHPTGALCPRKPPVFGGAPRNGSIARGVEGERFYGDVSADCVVTCCIDWRCSFHLPIIDGRERSILELGLQVTAARITCMRPVPSSACRQTL